MGNVNIICAAQNCSKSLTPKGRGRPPKFCSETCRQTASRERARADRAATHLETVARLLVGEHVLVRRIWLDEARQTLHVQRDAIQRELEKLTGATDSSTKVKIEQLKSSSQRMQAVDRAFARLTDSAIELAEKPPQ